MTHRIRELIPCSVSLSYMLKFLMISICIFLSDLRASGSLNPGVSISVMLPMEPDLTQEVTDLKDYLLSKLQANSWPGKYFSLAISTI